VEVSWIFATKWAVPAIEWAFLAIKGAFPAIKWAVAAIKGRASRILAAWPMEGA
jgi:hypothetical protein